MKELVLNDCTRPHLFDLNMEYKASLHNIRYEEYLFLGCFLQDQSLGIDLASITLPLIGGLGTHLGYRTL